MHSYHNTLNHEPQLTMQFEAVAKSQDNDVLNVFKSSLIPLTACEVWTKLVQSNSKVLLTSVRRSVDTLLHKFLIVRCDEKKQGLYGRLNFTYKYNK